MFSELEPPDSSHLLLSDSIKKVLELSVGSAREQGLFFIGTASLVVGIMRLESENINTILAHFDVQRQDIIEQAESYALKDDNFEKQSSHEYLAQKDADPIGCFATIRNVFGLSNE